MGWVVGEGVGLFCSSNQWWDLGVWKKGGQTFFGLADGGGEVSGYDAINERAFALK